VYVYLGSCIFEYSTIVLCGGGGGGGQWGGTPFTPPPPPRCHVQPSPNWSSIVVIRNRTLLLGDAYRSETEAFIVAVHELFVTARMNVTDIAQARRRGDMLRLWELPPVLPLTEVPLMPYPPTGLPDTVAHSVAAAAAAQGSAVAVHYLHRQRRPIQPVGRINGDSGYIGVVNSRLTDPARRWHAARMVSSQTYSAGDFSVAAEAADAIDRVVVEKCIAAGRECRAHVHPAPCSPSLSRPPPPLPRRHLPHGGAAERGHHRVAARGRAPLLLGLPLRRVPLHRHARRTAGHAAGGSARQRGSRRRRNRGGRVGSVVARNLTHQSQRWRRWRRRWRSWWRRGRRQQRRVPGRV
jgi:hypothetical protein